MSNRRTGYSTHKLAGAEGSALRSPDNVLAKRLQRQRWDEFAKASVAAQSSRRSASRVNGNYFFGRDEMGQTVETASLAMLRIKIIGPRVLMSFKREDGFKDGGDWKEIEKTVLREGVHRKEIWVSTHVLAAVRSFKDIRLRYQNELIALERMIQGIEPDESKAQDEADPNARWKKILENLKTNAGLDSMIASLESLRAPLSEKEVVVMRVIAAARLEETIRAFHEIRTLPENERAHPVCVATPRLSAVRYRIHKRQLDIAPMMSLAQWRENALRIKRDEWLFSRIAKCSSSIRSIQESAETDAKKLDVMQRLQGMIDMLIPLQKEIARLKEKTCWTENDEGTLGSMISDFESMQNEAKALPWHDKAQRKKLQGSIRSLKKKKERTEEEQGRLSSLETQLGSMKAEAMGCRFMKERSALRKSINELQARKNIAEDSAKPLEDAGQAYEAKKTEARRCIWANARLFDSNNRKPEVLEGSYGWIHRHIKNDSPGQAREIVSEYLRIIGTDSPRFILDGLLKSPEPYLAGVVDELKLAVPALEANDARNAQKHFALAGVKMRDIVFPEKSG